MVLVGVIPEAELKSRTIGIIFSEWKRVVSITTVVIHISNSCYQTLWNIIRMMLMLMLGVVYGNNMFINWNWLTTMYHVTLLTATNMKLYLFIHYWFFLPLPVSINMMLISFLTTKALLIFHISINNNKHGAVLSILYLRRYSLRNALLKGTSWYGTTPCDYSRHLTTYYYWLNFPGW